MSKIVCEVCRSSNIVKQGEFFICSNCGVKYTPEQLSALWVNDTSASEEYNQGKNNSTNIDLETIFLLARRARDEMNAVNAEKYYGELMKFCPENWEVVFFQTYFQAFSMKILDISHSSTLVSNSLDDVYLCIARIVDTTEQSRAVSMINKYLKIMVESYARSTKDLYIKTCGIDLGALSRYTGQMSNIHSIYSTAEHNLKIYFPNLVIELAEIQKSYVVSLIKNTSLVSNEELKLLTHRLETEIKTVEPEYVLPESDNALLNGAKQIKNKLIAFVKQFN